MKILVLGGTAWLGYTVAKTALTSGYEVTCLARGDAVPSGVRLVRADRDDDTALTGVAAEHWDAVIDVARQPIHVRRAVRDPQGLADRYVFVSTCNVYACQEEVGADEDAPRLPPLEADRIGPPDDYGPAKVACEDAVLEAYGPDRTAIARAGLIGGPGDPSERTTYWVRRFANPSNDAGAVLVPDTAELPTALIDVRDLATWLLHLAEEKSSGIFNAVGNPVRFPEHIEIARSVAHHAGPVVTASEDWLLAQGVNPWSGKRSLPLWLADHAWYGMNARANTRAVAAGLTLRPLRDTLTDILAQEPPLTSAENRGAGLTDAEENNLLNELHLGGFSGEN
ncbi:NAD-dependent epimerase/dehydratase family protein [Arthrobacter sp. SIMBA_036]|uniref:NAD-dependent epimerase/dehydratase family protein n=3 Tax=Bacteria TaxID=2 RepID=UPI00397C0A20